MRASRDLAVGGASSTAADLREPRDARPDSVALKIVWDQLFVEEIASQHSRDVRSRTDQ